MGALFFLWIAGLRVINPTEINWVMQLDWRIHFLGWHFFRDEPWSWPPGRIIGYFHAPDGTAIGFTDSIPILAFLLKPFSSLLPDTFQYLGLWLLVCFALQGAFGVLLARIWTPHRALQLLAAALFVLMPVLLIRVGHPSLCAHWLLLWGLWLYFGARRGAKQHLAHQITLGFIAGLMHPYLAVMTLSILLALAVKERAAAGLAGALVAVVVGWWAAGLFTVSGAENLGAEGLGYYSMNLFSIITPSGWSTMLPELPIGAPGQTYEGFQYLGAGALLLLAAAAALRVRGKRLESMRPIWPIVAAATCCAVYALSPRVTAFEQVILDLSGPSLDRLGIFRATGRFFWPMAYLLLTGAIATVASGVKPRTALAVFLTVLCIQFADLRRAHAERRVTSRSDGFHGHVLRLQSSLWSAALPHYRHMVLLYPQQCGQAPISFEWPAYLAGLHGLTINTGEVARPDAAKTRAYCEELSAQLREGHVDDDTIYLVNRPLLPSLRERASTPLHCLEADGVPVCITESSFAKWRAMVSAP